MNKRKYEYLEECFDQLQNDYHYAQTEIRELKDAIELLKSILHANNIEIPNLEESIPF
jgi:hypothetical protein